MREYFRVMGEVAFMVGSPCIGCIVKLVLRSYARGRRVSCGAFVFLRRGARHHIARCKHDDHTSSTAHRNAKLTASYHST